MTSAIYNRDYVLIIDKSGSMNDADVDGESRWKAAAESTFAVAVELLKVSNNGREAPSITVYLFSDDYIRNKVEDAKVVKEMFANNSPGGGTDLAKVLESAFRHFQEHKKQGRFSGPTAKAGETIIVVTDGIPKDQGAVKKSIIKMSNKLDRDNELAISFIQIGKDKDAAKFLKTLDDDLKDKSSDDNLQGNSVDNNHHGKGKHTAKFDIVDTVNMDDIEDMGLTEVLMKAISD